MDLQAAFRARLLANAAIASLANKIAWGGIPEGTTMPYVRLTTVGAGREWTHSGPVALLNPRVQIDIFGSTAATTAALANAIQDEMERTTDVTAGGWDFLPPGMIEGEQGPIVEDLAGGGQSYGMIHDYSFYAQPAE